MADRQMLDKASMLLLKLACLNNADRDSVLRCVDDHSRNNIERKLESLINNEIVKKVYYKDIEKEVFDCVLEHEFGNETYLSLTRNISHSQKEEYVKSMDRCEAIFLAVYGNMAWVKDYTLKYHQVSSDEVDRLSAGLSDSNDISMALENIVYQDFLGTPQ